VAENNPITMQLFLTELKKKVSDSNAKLLLHSAVIRSGISPAADAPLKNEEAHNLCMELIKGGGPGFQVGRTVYSQINRQ
jgi:hypothetical protein